MAHVPDRGAGHLGGPPSPLGDLVCVACGTSFAARTSFRRHLREHHGEAP